MAANPFIDPILQQVRGAGVALTGAAVTVAAGGTVMAWLPAISIGASVITSLIQVYNHKKRSEEEAARERRRDEVLEQNARRNEETLLRQGQEVRNLLEEQTNRQEISLVQWEQRQAQVRERAAIDSAIYDLDNRVNLYRNYQRQFANDQPRLVEETKIFQRDIGACLISLSSGMLRGHVNLNDLRIWANSVAFHIQMNSLMTHAGIQSTESLRIVVDIHRETARNLCSAYRRYNQLPSTVGEIREVEMYFHDASNHVEYPINRSVHVNTSQIACSSNLVGTETQNNEGPAIEMAESSHSGVILMLVLSAMVGIIAMVFIDLVPSQ